MNGYHGVLIISLICIIFIISYGTYRCKTPEFADPLTYALTNAYGLDKYLDGWGLSHFFFFMLLGYLYPKYVVFSFVLGCVWELVEYSMKEHPFYLTACELKTHKGEGWWYGRWQDIVMNSAGLAIGRYIATKRI
jgi:hypothetical protein